MSKSRNSVLNLADYKGKWVVERTPPPNANEHNFTNKPILNHIILYDIYGVIF